MPAEIRETRTAVVALIGDHAYKFKKAVDLGFVDLRAPATRERVIEKELLLNRRMAPDVYLDTATLRGSDGEVDEHVLVMRRMPEDRRLSTLLRDPALSIEQLEELVRRVARQLADFHSRAHRGAAINAEAGQQGLRRRWTDNLAELERFVGTLVDESAYRSIVELALEYVDGREALFDRRCGAGRCVDGHGDVTAEDVFFLDDGPRILDCAEFDDRLRWVDALDDAACFAADLEHLDRPDLARHFIDRYVEFSTTASVRSLEHHYIAYRAVVRAKAACCRAEHGLRAARIEVTDYLRIALRHLGAGRVRLILVGGAPGTGKTTVGGMLADALGAVLLSTDTIRREMLGDEAAYDDESRAAVYDALLVRATRALTNAESVVADGMWQTEQERALARRCALETHSALIEFECHAPPALASARAKRRLAMAAGGAQEGGEIALALAERRAVWPRATPVDCSGSPYEALHDMAEVLVLPEWWRSADH